MPVSMQTCPACQGHRLVPNARTGEPVVCPLCGGSGSIEPNFARRLYFYVINQVLLASQRVNGALQIDARAEFEWIWGAATSTGIFTTEFTDSAGRAMQNNPVNNANQWGTAQLPLALVVPVILGASSALNWTLVDTSVAGNTVQLVLSGYELYPVKE